MYRSRFHPRFVRLRLENLEDRRQPGSLLTEIAGWSPLGETLGVLRGDRTPEAATSSLPPRPAEHLLFAPGVELRAGREVQERREPFVTPRPRGDSDPEELLTAVSVSIRPADGGGASITKSDGTWYTLAPMPSRRQEVSTAVLNGEIFVMGGLNASGQPVTTVEVYNPKTDTWRTAAPLPFANDHQASAVAGGVLYTFGGRSNRVLAYEPTKDTWYDVAPMQYQHGNTPAVAVVADWIYVAGGTGPGMVGNEFEVYDPGSNTWATLAPMNVPRNHTAGGNLADYFFVAGGRGNAQAGSAFEVYDPNLNEWIRLPDMPTARSGVTAGVVNYCLYVFGGEMPGVFREVEIFDAYNMEWRSATPMPTPRHGIFASVIDNAIYIPGGATQQGVGASNVNEVFVIEV